MTTPAPNLDGRGSVINGAQLAQLVDNRSVFNIVDFKQARFEEVAAKIGPLKAHRLILDHASFDKHIVIEVQADHVSCVGTRFHYGATLRLNGGVVDATDAIFGTTSSISTSLAWGEPCQPRLVSLRGVDVSNLVLVDVDLSLCLFAGSHRLDQLRLEDRTRFGSPPDNWRWARRQVLAEESITRGWIDVPDAFPLRWERLAALYRSLRKAFEDGKNEAGAGDFYYGEMEARRHSTLTSRAEKLILWVYWLLSGYGQRAGRAVAALGVLVAVVCVLLFTVGLPGQLVWTGTRVDQALRIGMGAVVFREAGQALTSAGNWTVMVARFAGPVLLALAVLAIRARVKR